MNAILTNKKGQYNYGKNDALILFQKGFWGTSDENIAKILSFTPETFTEEKEKLIYRHIKCNFTSKNQLATTFSISEDEITNIYNKIDSIYKAEKNKPQNVDKVEQKFAALVSRIDYLEMRVRELEENEYNNSYSRDRSPKRRRRRTSSPDSYTRW